MFVLTSQKIISIPIIKGVELFRLLCKSCWLFNFNFEKIKKSRWHNDFDIEYIK